MSRLGVSPGLVTAEPRLTPKRLTLKPQIALNRQPACHGSTSKAKPTEPDPAYGTFEYAGQIINVQPDSDLRDNEDVPLNFYEYQPPRPLQEIDSVLNAVGNGANLTCRFPVHCEYKDSGVTWLGEIPKHWGLAEQTAFRPTQ